MATSEPESEVRVSCLQMEPRVGAKDLHLAHRLEMIDQAADAGADLVVLPELCNSGYVFNTREEARNLAEEIPDGPAGPGRTPPRATGCNLSPESPNARGARSTIPPWSWVPRA